MSQSSVLSSLLSWRGLLIAVCAIVGINVAITTFTALYNLYIHPLAKFKGPKSWIAFPILKSVAQLRGQLDYRIRDFHRTYGDIVRISPDELSCTSAAAWKDIYGHGHAELLKYFPPGANSGPTNIIKSNASDHFRFRRAMLPAFSDKALEQQESLIRKYVNLLVEKLRDTASAGQATNMVKWYTYTTFDLIGDIAYGESFGGLENGKQNQWTTNIENMMRLFPILVLAGSSPILSKIFLFLASDKITASRDAHAKMTTDLTLKRINNKDKEHRGDFMDFMMRAQGKEHGLTNEELAANADTLMVAGSETTATLLCGVTFHLLTTPEALARCVEEVRSTFQKEEEITFKSASANLPYMLACLDEGLRLFPPVPTVLFRQTAPNQITIIDGHEVPGLTKVGVHHMATYHSSTNFHDASTFHPERWLPEAKTDQESPFFNDRRDAFQPFSVGPRNCIGRNLAYHEMRLILARVLWRFDLELDESCRDWAESQRTFALWEKPPLMVRLKDRLDGAGVEL